MAFLTAAFVVAPQLAGYWVLLVLGMSFGPPLLTTAHGLLAKPEEKPWRLHVRHQAVHGVRALLREAVTLAVLPYTAHCQLDAVLRTLYRMAISRTRLLEWTTASEAEQRAAAGGRDHYEVMCAATLASLGLGAILAIESPGGLAAAAPLVVAWLLGPLVAWWLSQPAPDRLPAPTPREVEHLRRWARHTWHYFDVHVNRRENWLAPDNVQLRSRWIVAPRTSPTNIGMGLLADLAACDLGYLAASRFVRRAERTLRTLERLERHRGHFYNWYDTRSLQPAEPRYVSTVDSGNLWGALTVLRVGLEELGQRPVADGNVVVGVIDTLEAIAALRPSCAWSDTAAFDAQLAELRQACADAHPRGARQTWRFLGHLRGMLHGLESKAAQAPSELRAWLAALRRQVATTHGELSRLAFWVSTPERDRLAVGQLDVTRQTALNRLWQRLEELDRSGRLGELPEAADQALATCAALGATTAAAADALAQLARRAVRAGAAARNELRRIRTLADRCRELSTADFRFLYHPRRKLLAVGYNVTENRRDESYYDLLASESRLTSYLAVSHGQLPQEHWFALGRLVAFTDGEPVLLSWSGSMFEYLMPKLLMPSYPTTLLDDACRAAVRRQMRYARRHGVPWGISESCYHAFDAGRAYRYRAFGVRGLGLEPGRAEELVIAPYASALGGLCYPREALANLESLERRGYLSPYGFYDAVDHTPNRCTPSGEPVACCTVMAHHSGMTLLALSTLLLGDRMPQRLLKDPVCRSHELLLQERAPEAVRPVDPKLVGVQPVTSFVARASVTPRSAASQSSRAACRWRAAVVAGPVCYLRDLQTAREWTNVELTADHDAEHPDTGPRRSESRVLRHDIDLRTEVAVALEDDVEVQRLGLVNLADTERRIEIASFAELTPATNGQRSAQFQWVPERATLLSGAGCEESGESARWTFQVLWIEAPRVGPAEFETSRTQFASREGWGASEPGEDLPRTPEMLAGSDPILSVRRTVTLAPHQMASVRLVTGAATTREQALALARRYHDPRLVDRALALAQAWAERVSLPAEPEAQAYCSR
jgi:hypothetical protein